jgi:iron(III) transport system ATP-binding protein
MPDAGRVRIAGTTVADADTWIEPERRRIGFVFQDYALFPHLTVRQNVAFGLRQGSKASRLKQADAVLDLVGLTIFAGRYPHQLSGGQQQRVALARALAPAPAVILLDEPFSNLDAALRGSTRDEVRQILKRTGTTAILVTHDQEEAMTFADRIAVMRSGRLEQVGTPEGCTSAPRRPSSPASWAARTWCAAKATAARRARPWASWRWRGLRTARSCCRCDPRRSASAPTAPAPPCG